MEMFEKPLTKEEYLDHAGKILETPCRYNLIDCLKELKFSRPAKNQIALQGFIDYLELDESLSVPFSPEQVGLTFIKSEQP